MIAAIRLGREQVRVLAELSADDAASASVDRLAVAAALLCMGDAVPPAALGAGGTAGAARVRRLIETPAMISQTRAAAVKVGVAGLALTGAPSCSATRQRSPA